MLDTICIVLMQGAGGAAEEVNDGSPAHDDIPYVLVYITVSSHICNDTSQASIDACFRCSLCAGMIQYTSAAG